MLDIGNDYSLNLANGQRLAGRRPSASGSLQQRSVSLSAAGSLNQGVGKIVPIHDTRFRFQQEHALPKPRQFMGTPKLYRAGRGSSVPLDLTLAGCFVKSNQELSRRIEFDILEVIVLQPHQG
ncbi:hypothetical protein KEM54_001856 [Ascosphaera aggregata]|nr:hypothetical protein KEM54_001856 [Ascosphaera aggregata]